MKVLGKIFLYLFILLLWGSVVLVYANKNARLSLLMELGAVRIEWQHPNTIADFEKTQQGSKSNCIIYSRGMGDEEVSDLVCSATTRTLYRKNGEGYVVQVFLIYKGEDMYNVGYYGQTNNLYSVAIVLDGKRRIAYQDDASDIGWITESPAHDVIVTKYKILDNGTFAPVDITADNPIVQWALAEFPLNRARMDMLTLRSKTQSEKTASVDSTIVTGQSEPAPPSAAPAANNSVPHKTYQRVVDLVFARDDYHLCREYLGSSWAWEKCENDFLAKKGKNACDVLFHQDGYYSQRMQCWIQATNNLSFCETITTPHLKEDCFRENYRSVRSESTCNELREYRSDCVAVIKEDISLCEHNSCRIFIAGKTGDKSLCAQFSEDDKEEPWSKPNCLIGVGVQRRDITLCNDFLRKDRIILCIEKIAFALNDPGVCQQLPSEQQDLCRGATKDGLVTDASIK